MADNYLEKRYEETLGSGRVKVKRVGHTVDELLSRARSYRGYNKSYKVSRSELERIVAVCSRVPSGCNQQVLRYYLSTHDTDASLVLPLLKFGAALPQLKLPFPGTEPEAFIICCTTASESRLVDIDLGISLQSMALKAVEMGLNTIMIGAFNQEKLRTTLNLPYQPLIVLAVGKGSEKIELVPTDETASRAYWRENGVHYVPKVRPGCLILNND